MTTPRRWAADDLERIAAARELRIAAPAADGGWHPPVPIWVVVTDDSVYVRTWHRRTSGWYGAALRSGRARVEVPGLSGTVAATDVADAGTDLRAASEPPADSAAVYRCYAAKATMKLTMSSATAPGACM
jgi:hypothetical protein